MAQLSNNSCCKGGFSALRVESDGETDGSVEFEDDFDGGGLNPVYMANLKRLWKMRQDAPEIDPATGKTKKEVWGHDLWFPHHSFKDILEGNLMKDFCNPTPITTPSPLLDLQSEVEMPPVVKPSQFSRRPHELVRDDQMYRFTQTEPVNTDHKNIQVELNRNNNLIDQGSETEDLDETIRAQVESEGRIRELELENVRLALENEQLRKQLKDLQDSPLHRVNPERGTLALLDTSPSSIDAEVASFMGRKVPKIMEKHVRPPTAHDDAELPVVNPAPVQSEPQQLPIKPEPIYSAAEIDTVASTMDVVSLNGSESSEKRKHRKPKIFAELCTAPKETTCEVATVSSTAGVSVYSVVKQESFKSVVQADATEFSVVRTESHGDAANVDRNVPTPGSSDSGSFSGPTKVFVNRNFQDLDSLPWATRKS